MPRKKNVNAHNYGQWTWYGERPFGHHATQYLFMLTVLVQTKKTNNERSKTEKKNNHLIKKNNFNI